MDNTREKLIELLETVPHPQRLYPDLFVDSLIANGVTIKSDCEDCASKATRLIDKLNGEIAKLRKAQQWISVSETLPDDDLPVLVTCGRGYRSFIARYDRIWKRWKVSHTLKITHWMPLPHYEKE
jgi:hypothetical protein